MRLRSRVIFEAVFRIMNQIWGRGFESIDTHFFRNQRGFFTLFWGQRLFDLAKNEKREYALILKSWLLCENQRDALNRVVEGELKRRILAVFAARWLEKDAKRVSPRRILGPDMLFANLELRESWEEKKKASSWGRWCRKDKKMVVAGRLELSTSSVWRMRSNQLN